MMHTVLRTIRNAVLVAIVFLAVGSTSHLDADEFGVKDFDHYTAIGPAATEKMVELFNLYETMLTNQLRELISKADPDYELEWWEDAITEMGIRREAWRGTAVDYYRGWAEEKGADPSSIQDLPSDWLSLEESYSDFFKIARVEGTLAYKMLIDLVEDAQAMSDFGWTDGLRLDDAKIIVENADSSLIEADQLISKYAAGEDQDRTRRDLLRVKEKLRTSLRAWSNRARMLTDIEGRIEEMTQGDMEAAARIEALEKAYTAFQSATEAKDVDIRLSAEAAHYHTLIEKHCEDFKTHQETWVKRVAPLTEGTLFDSLLAIEGPHGKVSQQMWRGIERINAALED